MSDMSSEKNGEPVRRVGRPEKPLDPGAGPRAHLAQELRDLRQACGVPTLRVLAAYAHTDHRRLGEAARDGSLPSWQVVEGYVRGCWDYFERKHHGPFADADDLAHWQALYRGAGGTLPEESRPESTGRELMPGLLPDSGALEPPAADLPPARPVALPLPPRSGRRRPVRLVVGAAAGLVLLMLGALAGVYAGISQRPNNTPARSASGQQHVRILVAAPSPACGFMIQDGFRSPATTTFSNATQVISVSLHGISAAVIQGTYQGIAYDWLESRPNGTRAGIQLRWASIRGHWHYCTATDEGGPVAALPDQVATIAVPAILRGEQVTCQSCIWHQHPYTAQCSNLYKNSNSTPSRA